MARKMRAFGSLLTATAKAWLEDDAQRRGAALAFYTALAISPLFVIIFFIVSLWFNASSARAQIFGQINNLIGEQGTRALQSIMANPQTHSEGVFASIVALATLLLTASGVFLELQSDLNFIWGVEANEVFGK